MQSRRNSHYVKKDWHDSSDSRKRLGVQGEDIACAYLKAQDIRVIDRNVRFKLGEIDIVALDGNRICFIEVKTRSSLEYGRPSLAVNYKKQRTIRQLAEIYCKYHPEYGSRSPRIDVIELLFLSGDRKYINYIKSAF